MQYAPLFEVSMVAAAVCCVVKCANPDTCTRKEAREMLV